MTRNYEPFTRYTDYTFYRGDTFCGSAVRVKSGGEMLLLGENGVLTLGVFRGEEKLLVRSFAADAQDEEGFIRWGLLPEETAAMEPGVCSYELELCLDPQRVYTVAAGAFFIRPDRVTAEVRG